MRHPALTTLLAIAGWAAADPAAAQRRQPDAGLLCRQAIRTAEREAALPPGLLLAIATVESGRTDTRGNVTPWAWSLRAQGRGEYFDSRDEAVRRAAALRSAGVTVMDVGCLQVNLHHHPDAFRGLPQAFDPLANARYAARFLRQLEAELGSLPAAVAAYHSRHRARGQAYRARVMAAWPGGQEVAVAALAPLPLPPPAAPPFRVELAEAGE